MYVLLTVLPLPLVEALSAHVTLWFQLFCYAQPAPLHTQVPLLRVINKR